ncbi:hypothetical protein GYA19_01930 [Candidatus Beckwithbacteria bacterium]|nr:hypothetical protein [Candidatus Beckwithbacteria bacterium]
MSKGTADTKHELGEQKDKALDEEMKSRLEELRGQIIKNRGIFLLSSDGVDSPDFEGLPWEQMNRKQRLELLKLYSDFLILSLNNGQTLDLAYLLVGKRKDELSPANLGFHAGFVATLSSGFLAEELEFLLSDQEVKPLPSIPAEPEI